MNEEERCGYFALRHYHAPFIKSQGTLTCTTIGWYHKRSLANSSRVTYMKSRGIRGRVYVEECRASQVPQEDLTRLDSVILTIERNDDVSN